MRYYITIALLITLGGCATHRVPAESLAVGRYYFGYSLIPPTANSIVQVFDDGNATLIQVPTTRTKSKNIVRMCKYRSALRTTTQGQFIRVPRISSELCFDQTTQKRTLTTRIIRESPPQSETIPISKEMKK